MNFKKIIAAMLSAMVMVPAGAQNNFEVAKNLDIFTSLYRELNLFYVDTVDTKKLVNNGINAMLSELDPYTTFYAEDDEEELKMMITGKYGGIGAGIRETKAGVVVTEPYEGMPAAEAGLKVGDVLVSIDGKSLKGLGSDKVSEMLRGTAGTSFVLQYKRPGTEKPTTVKITRRTIQKSIIPYYGMINDSIGYLMLNQYTEGCAKEMKRAIIGLRQKGMKRFILDLRRNGGGSLDEAVDIVNMFVDKDEEIVHTKGKIKQNCRTYKTNNEPIDTRMPIAVLVSSVTASAAEITCGAFQDLDRGVVIGTRTYGKGLVQTVRELPYGSSLKVTTSKYYIPSGRCVQAIDYKHRNEDGSVGRIPDSLTTVFHTRNGREVRDGGGVTPDIEVKGDSLPNIVYYLAESEVLFDYATNYCLAHPNVAEAKDFTISDEEYEEFSQTVLKSDFKYDRQSGKYLEELKKIAAFEGYLDQSKEEFEALQKKLTKNNTEYDLKRLKDKIKPLVEAEIIRRYYFERGEIVQQMRYDKALDKAIKTLQNDTEYEQILEGRK